MTRINTNLSSIIGQNILSRNQSTLQTALTRLSTGLRINSGKDDPSGLIASQVLGSELTSIGASISNSQRANNIVSTADAALSQVSSLLNDIRGLVQSSANKGAISSAEVAANQVQVDSALQSITRIGQTTVFGGEQLLNGNKAFNASGTVTGVFSSTVDIKVSSFDPSAARSGTGNDVTVGLTQGATKKTVDVVGDSQVVGGTSSLRNLSLGQSTRTTSTLSTSALFSGLSTDSTKATRTITQANLAALANTGSADGTVTLQITGVNQAGTATSHTLAAINTATLKSNTGPGYAGSNALVNAVNAQETTTGVHAAVESNGNVTLTSSFFGSAFNINLQATSATGTKSTRTINATGGGSDFDDIVADAGTNVTFDVVQGANTDTITVSINSLIAAGGTNALRGAYIASQITAQNTNTGATAAADANGNITITAAANSATAITVGNVGGTTSAPNQLVLTNTLGASTSSVGIADATALSNFNTIVGSQTNGTVSTHSTVLTITGNKGTANIDLGTLTDGANSKGNDVLRNYNPSTNQTGVNALIGLINSRIGSTGVKATINSSNNIVLTSSGVGSTSLASIDYASGNTASTAADDTLFSTTGTVTSQTGVNGTSNQTTYKIVGDLGSATITVNNDDVINNSQSLADSINRVTAQTGVSASTSGGNLANLSLSSQNYGANAVLSFTAISSTNSADVDLINGTSTQVASAGSDVKGTVSTTKGTASFTGSGAQINYSDTAISFIADTSASITSPTAAKTTVVGTAGAGAGLNNLTGTQSDTITFQLTGYANGASTSTSISVNVAALKADSRVLIDAINKVSVTSGVKAKIDPNAVSNNGASVVIESTSLGSGGSVGITATAATQAGDVTIFNNAATQTSTTPGLNAPATATASFDVTGGALFQIGPEVKFSNQVNISIDAVDTNLLGRNVNTTGTKALSALATGGTDQLSSADLGDAAKLVDQAISEISTLRGQLGALQKNVFESNIASLQSSYAQVTSAQSQIQDADFASETANLTRSQILVQAGTSVLAIANSAPQQVLALLRNG